jgi:hypothetical protein
MWETYGESVQFYVVYIREAHAIDSAVPLGGEEDPGLGGGANPIMEDAVTFEEREAAAATCATKLALEPMPMLVDDMDDTANKAFCAWPERLYLIGADGKVAYTGAPGPGGFEPDELEEAIENELAALLEAE